MMNPKDLGTIRELLTWWRTNKTKVLKKQAKGKSQAQMISAGARVKVGKTDAEISVGGSGSVSIWKQDATGTLVDTTKNVTAHLDWMNGGSTVSIGKEVLLMWFADERIWRIVGAECE